MQRDRRDVQQSLSRKGFEECQSPHHTHYIYYTAGGQKTPVKTRVSRGSNYKSLGDDLLGQMAKQCKLTKADFINLVDCPLSREEYEKRLVQNGGL